MRLVDGRAGVDAPGERLRVDVAYGPAVGDGLAELHRVAVDGERLYITGASYTGWTVMVTVAEARALVTLKVSASPPE